MTWLRGVVAPRSPVCATAYTVGALNAWKHNAHPTDEPLKCYNEARDSNIKNHWSTVRSHQIVKHNPYFCFSQDVLRKLFFFKAGKGKGSRRQKNIHITNRITKFLVPIFYKYCRNIITTRYQQCHRQTKRSEEALAENGGAL